MVLPQLVRVVIPPAANDFITMLKITSLASIVSLREIMTNAQVTSLNDHEACIGDTAIPARTVLWAAGVQASSIAKSLAVDLDRAARDRQAAGAARRLAGRPGIDEAVADPRCALRAAGRLSFHRSDRRRVRRSLARRRKSRDRGGGRRINSAKERGSHGALRFLGTWTKSLRPQLSTTNYQPFWTYSFTTSIRLSTTWLVKRSIATCTQ